MMMTESMCPKKAEKMKSEENKERFETYIESLTDILPPYLEDLEKVAHDTDVPIIRKDVQSLIKTLFAYKKPAHILEVGTAIGFSALMMKDFSGPDCRITTIEKYEKRIPIAKENFAAHDKEGRITLMEGDAADILGELSGSFDFVLMDAAKGQYGAFFPNVLRLLAPGGMILSDNVLQDGALIESKFAVTRRDRTIHKRMREYLHTLTHTEGLSTSILNIGDGVALSVKTDGR